ncbi:hypothetical protein KPC83_03300 [Collinsella sp. zg1085]|uniref:hypothetical protein n=1 Tax=Collinsella sp. zg1085 TaxID=2844380 RepID=UPI001C0CAFBB|nr:hypothetical protein [Collinsella sp. zg1085]QWT18169.1 hypothetical protein KPC83_03300 [Collinsella sp. zg1085]
MKHMVGAWMQYALSRRQLFASCAALFGTLALSACAPEQQNKGVGPLPDPELQVAPTDSADGVNVDLTHLNAMMIFSQIGYMNQNRDQFIGKTIKIKGNFDSYDNNGRRFYGVLITDTTGCCTTGLEFSSAEEKAYPADYPEIGNEMTVTGVFDTYTEEDITYIYLRDASFEASK